MKKPPSSVRNRMDSLFPFLVIAGFFLLWEFLASGEYISRLFFPAPSRILANLWQMVLDGRLATNTLATMSRLFIGLLCGIVPGISLGLAMGWSPRLRKLIDPFIAALHPLPKFAMFPLILIIFGIGETSKVIAVAITCFFPSLINSMAGVRQLSPVYFEAAKNYGASKLKTFQRVVWPGSLPMVLAGVRIAFAIALVVTLAVELLASREGLGVIIWFSWQTLKIVDLYSALIVIAVVGFSATFALKKISLRLAPWNADAERDTY
jgi:NitT/TauT family transport system permease protein